MRARLLLVVVAAAVGVAAAVALGFLLWPDPDPLEVELAASDRPDALPELSLTEAPPWTTDSYAGLGVWVDAFDFDPAYVEDPPVSADDVPVMAAGGARTLFLQASRQDERATGDVLDPWLLASFLLRAHAQDMDVVAWYLPKWTDDDARRLAAVRDFEVLGHRFDGLALDIEWVRDVEPAERNAALVELTAAVRAMVGQDPLGAIVYPPVQSEVINTSLWPDFPWSELADDYAVWMPMAYWSFRSEESGYRDPYRYTEESIRRLRNNLGDQSALVHPIGGIGAVDGVDDPPDPEEPMATVADLDRFAAAVADTGAVGASLYDWNATEAAGRLRMTELFAGAGVRSG